MPGGVTADNQSKELNGLVQDVLNGGLNIVEPLYGAIAATAAAVAAVAASATAAAVDIEDGFEDDVDADTDWLWEYNISIAGFW